MNKKRQRVAVGLSGGVDSAVAAWRLKRAGWEVIGLTMSIWDGAVPIPDLGISGCFGPGEARDLEAAREVAARVGIEHQVVALAEEYRRTVLDYFREEYLAGRTPNPCVRCNQRMKFGFLLEQARAQGVAFDKFATGHYARTNYDDTRGRWQLLRGRDAGKDQSYFLARLAQDQLAGLIFPLGDLQKDEVKAIARELGWADLAERAESQDFIECEDYSVLFRNGDARPGDFTTKDGRVLGRHRGIIHYTIGQRKGLELGGGGGAVVCAGDRCRPQPRGGGTARGTVFPPSGCPGPELGGAGRHAFNGFSLPGPDPPAAPRGAGGGDGGRRWPAGGIR